MYKILNITTNRWQDDNVFTKDVAIKITKALNVASIDTDDFFVIVKQREEYNK